MSDTALSLKNITRIFEQGDRTLTILGGINLDIRAGETVALLGPSGSGKTTLLQIAGLLAEPTSGEITIGDENMTGAGDRARTLARRAHIGFVYQAHHLLPEFSAMENVTLPQTMAGIPLSRAKKKAALLLGELGLDDRIRHRPGKLSGGEQQRVAIARALANDPSLILADEPTGNLDPQTAETVFAMFLRLAKEKRLAVLVATHNLELAKRMDRIVRLENGTLVQ